MAAGVVERVNSLVVAADDDDRGRVDVEHKVVAGLLDLTRVAGEKPAAAPDTLEVELIDARIGLELTLERVVGLVFFFSSGRRHTSSTRDWSSDVCSSD